MSLILRYLGVLFAFYSFLMLVMYLYNKFVVLSNISFPFTALGFFILGIILYVLSAAFDKNVEVDEDGHAKPRRM